MVTFFSPEGPFVLLIAGLLCGALSGLAFATTLKQQARAWLAKEQRDPEAMKSIELVLPFVGMASGACAFLGATLQIFTFSVGLSFALAVPVTVGGAIATWWQYSVILRQIQRGGVGAIDLGSFN